MPVKKVKGGWKVVSYVTGKTLKRKYKTKAAAQRKAATSRRRSKRKRHTGRTGGRNYSPAAVRKRVTARKKRRY